MGEEPKRPNVVAQLAGLGAIGVVVAVATQGALRYKDIFQSMNVELPWITELLLNASAWVHDQWAMAIPVLLAVSVGATWPLRSLDREKTPHAVVVAALATSLGLGVVWLALHLPVQKIRRSLESK